MTGCTCPRSGAYLCASCKALQARACPLVRTARACPLVRTTAVPNPAARAEAEANFQARVRRAALDLGWQFYHTRDARGSDPGFPDCVLCRPQQLIFWELKVGTAKATQAQRTWLSLLRTCPGVVDASVRYPREWETMVLLLSGKPGKICEGRWEPLL